MATQVLVAVAVDNTGKVEGHAGRAEYWQVYALVDDQVPQRVWDIRLTAAGCLHEWHVRDPSNGHPLHAVDVALAGSAGDGVIRRLALQGTRLLLTSATDPWQALLAWQVNRLPPDNPHTPDCLHPDQRASRERTGTQAGSL